MTVNLTKKLFWFFAILSGLLLLTYLFMVGYTFANAVASERIVEKTNDISGSLVNLETKYLKISGDINMNLAYNKGFVEARDVNYIVLEENETVLSYNQDE